jgi:N-acyl-D-amino-acid deacylase
MQKEMIEGQGHLKYDVTWNTLAEFLEHLTSRGVSTNIASFVGATTIRQYVLGADDKQPNKEELKQMCGLVEQAMLEGAMGVSSALIYAPAFYAKTEELIALAQSAAKYGGMYISHLRSEGAQFIEALEEFLTIARKSGARSEIYHLKAAGKNNWAKIDQALSLIEKAQNEGLPITADMYMYTAAQTGLDASMPPWVQAGGLQEWIKRLKDPSIRAKVEAEMKDPNCSWENGIQMASAEGVVLAGFYNEKLKPYTGWSLAKIAQTRGQSPEQTAMDLLIENNRDMPTVYFWMCEENIRRQLKMPWVSVGSDARSLAIEEPFIKSGTHPRAYGNFARFLSKYVRDESVMSLEEGIRRLTSLPASNLRIPLRGKLEAGYFADIVAFDYKNICDLATFEKPHQYSTGFVHVLVNGTPVLRDGKHTGANPGRVVKPTANVV